MAGCNWHLAKSHRSWDSFVRNINHTVQLDIFLEIFFCEIFLEEMLSGGMNCQHEFWWAARSILSKYPHCHPVFLAISPHFSCRNSWHPRKPKHLENVNHTVWSRVSGSDDPKAPASHSFSSSAAVRQPARLGVFPFPCDLRSFLFAWRTFIVIFKLSTFAPISTMWLFTDEK